MEFLGLGFFSWGYLGMNLLVEVADGLGQVVLRIRGGLG